MKSILVNTPQGQYKIPLQLVAEHRASYYTCEVDGNELNSDEWHEEIDYVMRDSFEGIDWLVNNTNWNAWKEVATKINDTVYTTDEDFWSNSDDFKITDL